MKSRLMTLRNVVILAVIAGLCSTAFGTVVYHEDFDQIIADGSWDDTQYVYGSSGGGQVGTADGAPGITPYPDGASYGGFFNLFANGDHCLYINKDSLGTYQANTTYTLSVYIGQRSDGYAGADWHLSMTEGDIVVDYTTTPTLVSLGTEVASATNITDPTPASGWMLVSVTKTIGASDPLIGTPIGVEMYASYNATIGGSLQQLQIDGITLDVIPEPATMILFGLGALGLPRKRVA